MTRHGPDCYYSSSPKPMRRHLGHGRPTAKPIGNDIGGTSHQVALVLDVGESASSSVNVMLVVVPSNFFAVIVVVVIPNWPKADHSMYSSWAGVAAAPSAAYDSVRASVDHTSAMAALDKATVVTPVSVIVSRSFCAAVCAVAVAISGMTDSPAPAIPTCA